MKADATTGADAAPPTLALLPTAKKKKGALISLATENSSPHEKPSKLSPLQ